MSEPILLEERPFEGVALLRLNRPEVFNALNLALRHARDQAEAQGLFGVDGVARERHLGRARVTITRGSSQAPPSPATMPTFTKLSAKRAVLDAMRRSHMQARSLPAPIAGPLIAAMMGTCSDSKARGMRWMPSR